MMKGGMAGLMKQAQDMQQKMANVKAELDTIEVEGAAGGGMVKANAEGLLPDGNQPTGPEPGQHAVRRPSVHERGGRPPLRTGPAPAG